jgi:hypothetical protein
MGKSLKERILDSVICIVFKDLADLNNEGKLPEAVYLEGLDIAALTKMVVELGIKFQRHEIKFFTQEVEGAEPFNVRNSYLRVLANVWAKEIYPNIRTRGEEYIVLKGESGSDREFVLKELENDVLVPVYTEEQYPDSPGKIVFDLTDYLNHSVAS